MLSEAGTLNKPVFLLFKVKDVKPLSSWLKLGVEEGESSVLFSLTPLQFQGKYVRKAFLC